LSKAVLTSAWAPVSQVAEKHWIPLTILVLNEPLIDIPFWSWQFGCQDAFLMMSHNCRNTGWTSSLVPARKIQIVEGGILASSLVSCLAFSSLRTRDGRSTVVGRLITLAAYLNDTAWTLNDTWRLATVRLPMRDHRGNVLACSMILRYSFDRVGRSRGLSWDLGGRIRYLMLAFG